MATGVRFIISGSNTDFDTDEVGTVTIEPVQSFVLQERQTAKPNLYFEGNTYFTVMLELLEAWKTTLAKVTTVIEAGVEMVIYPYYAFCPSYYLNVILVPDNIRKVYLYGEREAWVSHQLTFLQI